MTSTKRAVDGMVRDLNKIPSKLQTNSQNSRLADGTEKIKREIESDIIMKLKQRGIL